MKSMLFIWTIVVLLSISVTALHNSERERRSGISDQRLAELETLVALSKMKGKMVTVPVAFGVIDPEKIGKRKEEDPISDRYQSSQNEAKLKRYLWKRSREEIDNYHQEISRITQVQWKRNMDRKRDSWNLRD